ncbi:MAG: hypothetical protein WA924_10570 [Burkholderiaceae bacterium]
MANKNLRTRQKAIFRLELSPRQSKPRNPLVAAAHLRAAGPHRKSASGRRQQQQRALKKLLGGGGD